MKRVLWKWIPVGALLVALSGCGGGVADGDYAGAFKEYVISELKAGTWVLTADEGLTVDQVDSIQAEVLHEVTIADSMRAGRQEAIDAYVSTEQQLKYDMEVAEHITNSMRTASLPVGPTMPASITRPSKPMATTAIMPRKSRVQAGHGAVAQRPRSLCEI